MIEFSATIGILILDETIRSEVRGKDSEEIRDIFKNLSSRANYQYNIILGRFEVEEVKRILETRDLIFNRYTISKAEKIKRVLEGGSSSGNDKLLHFLKNAVSCFGLMAFDERCYSDARADNKFDAAEDLLNYFKVNFGFQFDYSKPIDRDAFIRFKNLFYRSDINEIELISQSLREFHDLGWIRPDLRVDIQGGCASSITANDSYIQKTTFL